MKNLFYFFSLFFILSLTAFGKILIVDNNPSLNTGNYRSIDTAYDAAAVGDTLYIVGSNTTYYLANKPLSLTKKITIIGPGYYLAENNIPTVSAFPATVSGTFALKADNISIVGLIGATFELFNNNTIIKYNNTSSISAGNSVTNILITQNYLNTIHLENMRGVVIAGNYFNGSIYGDTQESDNIAIYNNVFLGIGGIGTVNEIVANNIFAGITGGGNMNNTFQNNICEGNFLPSGNGNINNVAESDLFIGGSSPDGYYQLKLGSPAIGAGLNGVDIGMFGGQYPYKLGGLPPIPIIYELNVQSIANNASGVQVQLKVKSNP